MLKAKKMRIDVVSLHKKLEIILKMLVDTQMISNYRSVFRGRGLEFEDFRDYTLGDDSSMIDWKTSARAMKLLIKMFKEERELDVYILLDTSSSMIFGSTEKLKMEYAAEVAATFAFMITEAGDRAGLTMFTDKPVKVVPLSVGKKHFQIIMNYLVKPEFYGGDFDLQKILEFTMSISKKKGLMIIISDFIGLKKGWERALKLASVKFDVIGVMVRDPRDEYLPSEDLGQFVLQDPYTDASLLINPKKISEEYGKAAKNETAAIRKTFMKCNADLVKLTTEKSFMKPLIEYFIMRRSRTWR
ncbi:MAG: DUF58 domain-containing protein [Candidatus Aenigmarchaeota archaeon]|nr:DUF58 domain-containing protein [Candidatus Aenigmarchaeota archaeon]